MTGPATSPCVLLLAERDAAAALEGALAVLSCEVDVVGDAFSAMSEADSGDHDVYVLDFTMASDDARVFAYWLRDHDVDGRVIGIVEPVLGAAAGDLDELCDELVLSPATATELAPRLGIEAPVEPERRRLQVKVNAALLDAHEVPVPPEEATTDEGAKPALIVGLGAHAEAPTFDD